MGLVHWIAVAIGLSGSGGAPVHQEAGPQGVEIRAADIRVIDGDTIAHSGTRIRLLGFDAPETHALSCAYEHRLGRAATRRLEALVTGGHPLHLAVSGRQDRYGRELGHLYVGDQDVGTFLILEGLARPYRGGRRGPWCRADRGAVE
ncbi:thermonuclease family protein [Chachezhania sediminis]|uniref:thermonuclease family protein n=1 Tax=Chachezhania sediminis TaxID=2599291 RepID=UPI00131C179E|nr:thermonuclease family protein [Chachezhania sediminis]